MKLTLLEIGGIVEGEVIGDSGIIITGVSGIKEAHSGDITFLANPKYSTLMNITKASAIITDLEVTDAPKPIIRTKNPSLAFAKIANLIAPHPNTHPKTIHPTAIISKTAKIGRDVAIGAYTIVEENVSIGDETIIYGGCYLGHSSRIGNNCLIYPHVSIRERIEIGNKVIIHSGTVIGSDGFGFAEVEGVQEKIPQIGTVSIEDNVEIGANVTIDRARLEKTIIGKGTKIDNLVQIAHNVVIGENCIIVSQAGISGSTSLGRGVILAGQTGLVGHIHIGDNAIVMAQSGVTKDISPGEKVFGYPAKPHNEAKRSMILVAKLPELYNKIKELENKIEKLQNLMADSNSTKGKDG